MGKVYRIYLLVAVILITTSICFSSSSIYKVVVKSTGKIVEGKFSHETDTLIYLLVDGVQVQFKKEQLDLEKMKELNADYKHEPEEKNIVNNKDRDLKTLTPKAVDKKQKPVDLGEIARKNELKKKKSKEEFEARKESKREKEED